MIFALVLAASFAATPQQAALQALRPAGTIPPPTVVLSNVVGRYAVVRVRGGEIEGQEADSPILLERFWFGWQALGDVGPQACALGQFGVPLSAVESLWRGLPLALGDLACRRPPETIDAGPPADVSDVRALMPGPFVPYVIVSGEYALGDWYGRGGGQLLFKRTGRSWSDIAGGGGAMGSAYLRKRGVPTSAICAFHTYDAKCPK